MREHESMVWRMNKHLIRAHNPHFQSLHDQDSIGNLSMKYYSDNSNPRIDVDKNGNVTDVHHCHSEASSNSFTSNQFKVCMTFFKSVADNKQNSGMLRASAQSALEEDRLRGGEIERRCCSIQ
jgi:hypothetical protein